MKSPIAEKPLNNPGESLEKQLQDVLFDEVLFYLIISLMLIVLAGHEWWRWYTKAPPSPFVFSLFSLLVVAYSAVKVIRGIKKAKSIKLGLVGEKSVGQFLETLRKDGANVFHDIKASSFNLDHVVIHHSGVYVIETKTLSKPDRGEAKLVFDGERVLRNKRELDRNAVNQVLASSKWLGQLLESSTGFKFPIKPVVVYPGWFVEPTSEAKSSPVWVLNPKALPAFISNSRSKLSVEQVHMCSHHLSKHVRSS